MSVSSLCGCRFLDVFHHYRHSGLSQWRLVLSPPSRDRATSNRGPAHSAVLSGSSLHRGPQCAEPSNNARTATSDAQCTTTTCQPGTSWIVEWRC